MKYRDLRIALTGLGGAPQRIKGSHEMWKLPSGAMFLVVVNHPNDDVPANVVARFARLTSAKQGDGK